MSVNKKDICEVFAEALMLEPEDVKPESTLIEDLGAESIDFLDITFQLESKYNITIPRGSIITLAKNGLTDEEFAVNQKITALGAKRLKESELGLSEAKISEGMLLQDLPQTFTVNAFATLVEKQLENVETPIAARA